MVLMNVVICLMRLTAQKVQVNYQNKDGSDKAYGFQGSYSVDFYATRWDIMQHIKAIMIYFHDRDV